MMRNLYKPLTGLALAGMMLVAGGCDGITDLNEDPNVAPEVPENVLLPTLLTNLSYEVVGNDPARLTSHWLQQLVFTGDAGDGPDDYDVGEDDVNNLWEFYAYTDVLQNARILAEQAEGEQNYAYAGIAKIVSAYALGIMTDLWGSIPLSEAFDPENTAPAYDPQEAIYAELFELLDAGIADLSREMPVSVVPLTSQADLLYRGDLARWEKFAYTLKARYAIHLTEAPGHTAAAQAQIALEALEMGFMSNADDAEIEYSSQKGAENPWFQFAIDGKWDTRDQLAEYYVELLKGLNDPRLPYQARPQGAVDSNGEVEGFEDDTPEYVGHTSGVDGVGASQYSSIGEFYSAADAPLTWVSYAEALFIKAEATLITQGAAAAQPIFEEAIRANMEKIGVGSDEVEDYIGSLPALTDADVDPMEVLITQKYIANFLNLENFNDYRRTGYPELTPVGDVLPFVPLRFPYPESEHTRNAAQLAATGIPRGHDSMLYPVWWDTTVPEGALTPAQ